MSSSEIIRMRVYILKNMEIEDFTAQYEALLPNDAKKHIVIPLKRGYTQEDIHKLVIRSDYGEKDQKLNKIRHTNVELINIQGDKINTTESSFIEQTFDIPTYERALHYVFMQAEKYNPLIGAYYWISPFGVQDEKAQQLYKLWNQARLSTPLCVLARNVSIAIIKVTQEDQNKYVLDSEFKELAIEEIKRCKDIEKENADNIRSEVLNPQLGIVWYPFPLFKPDDSALYGSVKI